MESFYLPEISFRFILFCALCHHHSPSFLLISPKNKKVFPNFVACRIPTGRTVSIFPGIFNLFNIPIIYYNILNREIS